MKNRTQPFEAILLDIEGTTSPMNFVYEVLFPFARSRLKSFLEDPSNQEKIKNDLINLKAEFDADKDCDLPQYNELDYLNFLMDADRKSSALKSIQGKIWEEGFISGDLKGELFSDVAPALERWRSAGYKTYIYSSGSVLAQKLLFQYSVAGNLTCFLYGHFDTAIGAKIESESYTKISQKIRVDPKNILFISDAPKELIAAKEAGLEVLFSNRPGNIYKNENFSEVSSFDQVC